MTTEPINPSAPPPSTPSQDRRLEGRRVLITGGGSGIGLATAELFAAKGAAVSVIDRNVEAAESVCQRSGGLAQKTDVSVKTAVVDAVEAAVKKMGGIDGIVASAGISGYTKLEESSDDYWDRMMAVNLNGIFYTCRAALPHMRKNAGATIVTIASSVALIPTSPGAAYAASKGGVLGLNKTLALECAPHIRVNAVCPGMTDTPINPQHVTRDDSGEWLPFVRTRYLMQRVGEATEMAYAALYLTSYESSYVTGTTISVDGGRTYY